MNEVNVSKNTVTKLISEITPYKDNPRKNDKTVEVLCEIIPKVGFNVPIVIDKNNVIVKGHARYEAAKRLGMESVPCIITEASEDAIKADRIADNKISEFTEWVNEELLHERDMLDFDFDFTKVGLPQSYNYSLPEFDFEEFDFDNSEQETEEERRARYEAFLKQQIEESEQSVQMTTQDAIKKAQDKVNNPSASKRDYRRCVCEKCGNVIYVDANILYGKFGTVRRG